ncbi:MAG: membrane integrity-associated transporter subunit PqiC [Sulfurospirillum sp.]|nr:membrane integrity-associated transporter subunit PqiC [Sulfurospirillum sp.]
MSKVFVLMVLIVLSGCSFKEVQKAPTKYTLERQTLEKVTTKYSFGVLKIPQIKAPQHLRSEYIWYSNDSLSMHHYLYAKWSENFGTLFSRSLGEILYESGLFGTVFYESSKMNADLLLEMQILEAKQVVQDKQAKVQFSVRLHMIDQTDNHLIDSQVFRYTVLCESIDAKGAVRAYNVMMQKLGSDVLLWIKKLAKES